MSARTPYGQEPDELRVGESLSAHKIGRYYSLRLPSYHPDATEIIRMVPTAHWDRSDGSWRVHAARHETLLKAMGRIATIPGMNQAPAQVSARATSRPKSEAKPQRTLILADTPCEIGQILTYRRKPVAVEQIGRVFEADSRYAKWGRPELNGKMVRYVSHHSATPEEIAAWERKLDERRQEAERVSEPDPEPGF